LVLARTGTKNGALKLTMFTSVSEEDSSARAAQDHRDLIAELLALPWAAIDDTVERRAVDAQRQLARTGHHRMPPVDILVAALADRHQLGILHYDRDYDLIAARADLRFASEWLAKAGRSDVPGGTSAGLRPLTEKGYIPTVKICELVRPL